MWVRYIPSLTSTAYPQLCTRAENRADIKTLEMKKRDMNGVLARENTTNDEY
ncbi:hypothetical protein PISMIDRAFT_679062 [Pisolithus microcarpus 441]|uniref:Uncharacterized protein n=1 Tax=Pisolithus microcarpus 441 TaxID=765257 RepID=A0A0C9Z3G3_9AGAM|nr:hypothetical protein PISMIDRAFT_679062 [Pisolithus microcarpus 441]